MIVSIEIIIMPRNYNYIIFKSKITFMATLHPQGYKIELESE